MRRPTAFALAIALLFASWPAQALDVFIPVERGAGALPASAGAAPLGSAPGLSGTASLGVSLGPSLPLFHLPGPAAASDSTPQAVPEGPALVEAKVEVLRERLKLALPAEGIAQGAGPALRAVRDALGEVSLEQLQSMPEGDLNAFGQTLMDRVLKARSIPADGDVVAAPVAPTPAVENILPLAAPEAFRDEAATSPPAPETPSARRGGGFLRAVLKRVAAGLLPFALMIVGVEAMAAGVYSGAYPSAYEFIKAWGLVPAEFIATLAKGDPLAIIGELPRLFTHMFLHTSWKHLESNFSTLATYAPVLLAAAKPSLFLKVFFASGLLGGLFAVLVDSGGSLPMIGASGGVLGVMGAISALALKLRVSGAGARTVWELVVQTAVLFAGAFALWHFVLNLLYLFTQMAGLVGPGTAFDAHVGGWLTGFVLAWFSARRAGSVKPGPGGGAG